MTVTTVAGGPLDTKPLTTVLAEWRAADRRWEAMSRDDPEFRAASIDVLRAWLAYHAAADQREPGEFALVTDDERVYVAASDGVEGTLGYAPGAMLGHRIEDFAGPAVAAATGELWDSFVREGRQDGTFDLAHSDGSTVPMRYQARAHFPIPGFHLSRLWPDAGRAEEQRPPR